MRLALVLVCLCAPLAAQPMLNNEGTLRWQLSLPWFGGWSGIEVSAQGARMTVISDRGHLLQAQLQRSADGRLARVDVQTATPLSQPDGRRLAKRGADAEGLAIADDGTAFVSFEHRHRIMRTDLATGRTSGRIDLPFDNAMGDNSGVEALAIGPEGALFALTEEAPANGGPFPLYTYAEGAWRVAARIPQRPPFVPVGMDFDSKGRLWLLERTVTPLGFRTRIRLFTFQPVPREFVMLTSIPARYDNLEGISAWDDTHGQTWLSLISDDNFFAFQRTQIVELSVLE